MELYAPQARRSVIAITALAAAGLILTGCKSGGTGAAATAGQSSAGSTAASGTATSPAKSSGSGSGSGSGGSASTVVSSGSLPFPTTVGDTWVYKNSNGSTTKNKVDSTKQVAAGQKVLLTSTDTINGTTTHFNYAYIVEPNGKISIPVTQLGSTGVTYKVISGGEYWPSAAQLAGGKAYHSTMTMEFTIAGKTQKITAHTTATGDGNQSVTVPAGTYSATEVTELTSEKFDGIKANTEIKTWLAPGVGPVQSEVISFMGVTKDITNKEELVSFTKG